MSALDSLRRAIRQQTDVIGQPVTNLIGPVAALGLPLEVVTDSAWLLLRLPGSKLLTPDEYYGRYATLDERHVEEVPAKDGLVIVVAPQTEVFLLRGVADVAGTITAPIEIATSSGEGEWGVYVNGNLARRGNGAKEFSLSLPEGRVLFEIIVVASAFALQFPPGLRIQPLRDVLTAPIWHSVETDYADPKSGNPAVHLKWYNNPRVGGWSILRRELEPLAPIIQLGLPNSSGEFGLAIPDADGSLVSSITLGSALYAGFEHIGQAMDADYDSVASITFEGTPYIGITSIKAQLPADRLDSNEFWLGRTLGTGVFRELTRIQRTGLDQLVPYDDLAVVYGAPYEYALQAYGLFDPTALSPMSEIRYVRAGDLTPPGSIQVIPSYPQSVNGLITIVFDTPADEDYAGVRVFFRYVAQSGNVASATSTTIVLPEPVPFDPKGYIIEILSGPCQGQERRIKELQAGTVGTLVLEDGDSWYQETPTSASTFQFYKFLDVKTDHGLPNTLDQFNFAAITDPGDASKRLKGLYYFPTFDLANNVQDLFGTDVFVYDYDPDTDTIDDNNQPPVVGIRQLRPIEQENNYPEPFNDTANYAIVELSARDPVDELEGVIIEYRSRKTTFGTITATGPDTLTDEQQAWAVDEHMNYLVQVISPGALESAPLTLAFVSARTIDLSVRRFDGGSGTVLVSNGIPLSRGTVLAVDLPNVAISIDGVEKPLYIEALPGTYPDGSLRAILVQFSHSLTSPVAATMTVGLRRTTIDISKTVVAQGKPVAAALPSQTSYLNQALEGFTFQKAVQHGVVGVGSGTTIFGVFNLTDATDARWNAYLRSVNAAGVIALLNAAQANGKKIILDLAQSDTCTNADGTFNQTLWQSRIDAYNAIDLTPYITDGTLIGHFVIDQPHQTSKHGGVAVPHATVEALAAYSKTKWPTLETYVRMPPSRMTGFVWTALDNAWAQYGSRAGDVNLFVTTQTQAAKALGLGLMWGMGVLNGGIAGTGTPMTAEEIRMYGPPLVTATYSKGFFIESGDPATDWTNLNGVQAPAIADIKAMQTASSGGTTSYTDAESRALDYEARHWWCFYNDGVTTTCSGLSGSARALQYNKGERARTCFTLWCQTGDVAWYDRAFTYLEAYRTQYWIGNVAPPENMIPESIMAAYWLSGYEGWKTGLLTNYTKTYSVLPPERLRLPGLTTVANDGRTITKALLCCMFGAMTQDTTVVPRLDGRSWSELALLHFAIPIETQLTDGSFNWRCGVDPDWGLNEPLETGTSNYQLAQLLTAMITMHEHHVSDSRMSAFVRRSLTYLETQYRSAQKDWRFHSGLTTAPGATGNWDLNTTLAAPYAWLARTASETTWRARAEEAVTEANTLANVGNNAGLDGSGHIMASTFRTNAAYYSYGVSRTTMWLGTGASPVALAMALGNPEGVGIFAAGVIKANTAQTLTMLEPWIEEPTVGSDFEIAWVTNIPASVTGNVLDDPRGTRSRFVAVPKTENSNHFQVRAHDKDGLYSDILSYTPDFDSIPEITDVSSRLDTVQDHLYLTGSVDDDCGSFAWWLEGSIDAGDPLPATPNNTTGDDTSQQKAFAMDFPLFDGRRKKLTIRPYSLPHQQGITGSDFVREFSRSPRTILHWEDKDDKGSTSAVTLMLSFECVPPIQVDWGDLDDAGEYTKFVESADRANKKLVDTAAGWVPGQFRPDTTTYTEYYVRVVKPGGFEAFAPIADNTATELILTEWFDTTWWGKTPGADDVQSDWPLQVRNGLTYFRFGPQAFKNQFDGNFIGTFDADFVERYPNGDLHVQYFTKMSGVPAEPFNNWIADPDTLPEFTTLTLVSGQGSVTVRVDGFDDDTKSWIAFGRKGRSPTRGSPNEGLETEGPQKGELDPQYIKFNGLVTTAKEFEFSAGDGRWWVTACPVNSKGEYGPCRSQFVDVTGGGPIQGESAKLTKFYGRQADAPSVDGAQAYNIIIYEHNVLADVAHTNVEMKIYAVRDDKPGTELEITSIKFDGSLEKTGPAGTERRPWQDAMRGNNNEILFTQVRKDDIDEVGSDLAGVPYTLQGSFLHLTGDVRGIEGGDAIQRTWNYRAVVYEDGIVVDEIPAIPVPGWFQSSAIRPGFLGEPLAATINSGACAPGADGVWRASPGIQTRVTWQLDPAKVNDTDYFIEVAIARDPAGAEFNGVINQSAGQANGDYTFVDSELVAFGAQTLVDFVATDNLQFPEHVPETGTANTSDGYGYKTLTLPGAHPVLTSVLANGSLLTEATVTSTVLQAKAGFGQSSPIGPSNGNAVFMLEGYPLVLASATPTLHHIQLADYPIVVRNASRGFDLQLYTNQSGPAYKIVLNSIQVMPSLGTFNDDDMEITYSYRDGDLTNGTRFMHWKVIDSEAGLMRVWNELATTTGQVITVNGTCDSAVQGAAVHYWKFRIRIARKGSNEVVADAFTNQITMTAGTCIPQGPVA